MLSSFSLFSASEDNNEGDRMEQASPDFLNPVMEFSWVISEVNVSFENTDICEGMVII
jgi:hypothetical protein